AAIHGCQGVAAVQDRAVGGLDQPQQQARQGGLAAAALARDGRDGRPVLVDGQRHAVHGDGVAFVQQSPAKDPRDVLGFQERCHDGPSSYRWQDTQRSGLISSRTGTSTEQRGMTNGQRGWNVQPGGGASKDGVSPGMPRKSSLVSRFGKLLISSWV